MILPTKGISPDRSLLSIGEDIVSGLDQPKSVTEAWVDTQSEWRRRNVRERLTFDWFSLALAMLFAIGIVDYTQDGRLRRTDATPTP